MPGVGHNSGEPAAKKVGGLDTSGLISIVQRIEKLSEEKQAIQGDISDVYSEAKGRGFDVRTIRAVVKERKKDAADRAEQQTLLEVYLNALGMLD